ncbi:ubiquinol-cytochrome c chaperone [Artemisia annua]|uniref:Ubiquinol-cytochrome c chaperone n=1 Tax=Artemisia annua TaxID=35608 RepID=A0A2U1M144_ARTAN|nr:ubiquinol-cytochrome c chaperone [Artemisia annua]
MVKPLKDSTISSHHFISSQILSSPITLATNLSSPISSPSPIIFSIRSLLPEPLRRTSSPEHRHSQSPDDRHRHRIIVIDLRRQVVVDHHHGIAFVNGWNVFAEDGSSKLDAAALPAVMAFTRYVRRECTCLSLTDKEAMMSDNFLFTPIENPKA